MWWHNRDILFFYGLDCYYSVINVLLPSPACSPWPVGVCHLHSWNLWSVVFLWFAAALHHMSSWCNLYCIQQRWQKRRKISALVCQKWLENDLKIITHMFCSMPCSLCCVGELPWQPECNQGQIFAFRNSTERTASLVNESNTTVVWIRSQADSLWRSSHISLHPFCLLLPWKYPQPYLDESSIAAGRYYMRRMRTCLCEWVCAYVGDLCV